MHVLAEATAIAPARNRASDGICGDARHNGEISDHNADPRGIPHAVDITQDAEHFDAHAYGLQIAGRILSGVERRVKYLVSNYGHGDVIFIDGHWGPNATGDEHVSHLHVSFNYDPATELSTAPLFGAVHPPPPPAPLPPIVVLPPPTTTDQGEGYLTSDFPTQLDPYGNGVVPLTGIPWAQVEAVTVCIHEGENPNVAHKYFAQPTAVLVREGTASRAVVRGGSPRGTYVIRVQHPS